MSTPRYCPGCGNRCSLDSPSCSTGEAYLRALRQARKKRAAAHSDRPAPQAAISPSPVPTPSADPASAGGGRPGPSASQRAGASPRRSGSRPRRDTASTPKKASLPRPGPEESYSSLSLGDKLAFQLHSLSRHMAQNQPREKAGQGRILALLAQRGELTQRELAALTGIRSSSLSELLGKLEGAGLIQRTPCPTDRRTTLVALTEPGRRQAHESATGSGPDPFRSLSAQEQGQLLSLLEKLNREIS